MSDNRFSRVCHYVVKLVLNNYYSSTEFGINCLIWRKHFTVYETSSHTFVFVECIERVFFFSYKVAVLTFSTCSIRTFSFQSVFQSIVPVSFVFISQNLSTTEMSFSLSGSFLGLVQVHYITQFQVPFVHQTHSHHPSWWTLEPVLEVCNLGCIPFSTKTEQVSFRL